MLYLGALGLCSLYLSWKTDDKIANFCCKSWRFQRHFRGIPLERSLGKGMWQSRNQWREVSFQAKGILQVTEEVRAIEWQPDSENWSSLCSSPSHISAPILWTLGGKNACGFCDLGWLIGWIPLPPDFMEFQEFGGIWVSSGKFGKIQEDSGEFSGILWGFVWRLVWIEWEFLGAFGQTPVFSKKIWDLGWFRAIWGLKGLLRK